MDGARDSSAVREARAPRLVEVVAAFSLATDLGLGQPMEHGLRSSLIACRLAQSLDLEAHEHESIYWATLLSMVGCTADSSEMSKLFGDDIEFRRGLFEVGPSQSAMARYFLGHADPEGGPLHRALTRGALVLSGMSTVMDAYLADCRITARFAERLGLGEAVSDALQQKFARWDGKGVPKDLAGEDIALPARMLNIAWRLEFEHRLRGVDAALELLRLHAGATLEPNLVETLTPSIPEVLGGLEDECWAAVVESEPPRARLTGETLDRALEALGDFADLKSPSFTGHSRAVAELAEAASWRLGLPEGEVVTVRHAALVHSLGRSGIPNTVWDKRGTLRSPSGSGCSSIPTSPTGSSGAGASPSSPTSPRRARSESTAAAIRGGSTALRWRLRRGPHVCPGGRRAWDQHQDRGSAHRAHLRQDRRLQPLDGDAVRDAARPRLGLHPLLYGPTIGFKPE